MAESNKPQDSLSDGNAGRCRKQGDDGCLEPMHHYLSTWCVTLSNIPYKQAALSQASHTAVAVDLHMPVNTEYVLQGVPFFPGKKQGVPLTTVMPANTIYVYRCISGKPSQAASAGPPAAGIITDTSTAVAVALRRQSLRINS